MSRVCIKGLPRYVAEDRLREVFSQKGEVTDAKLIRTKDGNSRQFAFVGFRSEKEANEAVKFFNNSYLDTCRIACEIARKVGDPNIPRRWSRHSQKKEESLAEEKTKSLKDKSLQGGGELNRKTKGLKHLKENIENNDPKLQEFLEIMQPRSKSKLWANDTMVGTDLDEKKTRSKKGKKKEINQMQDEGMGDESIESLGDKKMHDLARGEVVSDMDYFKSRVRKDWIDSDVEGNDSHGERQGDQEDHDIDEGGEGLDSHTKSMKDIIKMKTPSEVGLDEEEEVSTRLFVRNLPYTTTEDDLAELFANFGDISQVHLVVDKATKRSKGIAYVLYKLPESAIRALEDLDNSIFQGRLLHVMPAKQHVPTSEKLQSNPDAGSAPNFKQQKEDKRKASEASGDTRAWNSLFMRPDTVVENIARKYGIGKSDLLNPGADNLAASLALGEAQVIAETKEALVNAGVNVASLEDFASGKAENRRRSNHVFLVKNLPYGSSEADLAKMFEKFGSLDKIILPPTKTLALVIFLEAAEARAAFRGLAYKRYKDVPLYLEWAPDNILNSSSIAKTGQEKNAIVGAKDLKRAVVEHQLEEIPEEEVDPDRIESRSVFVKNLNFKTTEESLRKYFVENMKEGSIRSVKVKKHLKNGKNVSMGFGFIEFDSVETAGNVCRNLQGSILEGHALILQLCHAKDTLDERSAKKVEKDFSLTKIIVRNVAFEATDKDLRQLFSPFGQIKSLRLPMKLGSHRGFAFVEFITKQETEAAVKALSSTHLYGRHLVLERAKEGETLEELRARTASQFGTGEDEFQNPKKRKDLSFLDEGNTKIRRTIDS